MPMAPKPSKKIIILKCLEKLDDRKLYRYVFIMRYLMECSNMSDSYARITIYNLLVKGILEKDEFSKIYKINRERLLKEIKEIENKLEEKKEKIPA
jgi:hypothetical protein